MCVGVPWPEGRRQRQVNAPPLAGADDWYVARQLRKFRAGIRGGAPNDTGRSDHAAMSMAIQPDEHRRHRGLRALAAPVRGEVDDRTYGFTAITTPTAIGRTFFLWTVAGAIAFAAAAYILVS